MSLTRKKLCFILPKYRADAASHFSYVVELAQELQRDWDIFLFLEKGDVPDFLARNKFYLQRFRFLPLRWLENLLMIFWIRLRGYRNFYIHYSFLSAFNASWAVKLLGGRTFYWNCGLPWQYKKSRFREIFERAVYSTITFLVTGTPRLKEEYARHYGLPVSKIKILPNGINLKRFIRNENQVQQLRNGLNIPADFKIVLFVHHLSKRKGAHFLPEIAEGLKSERAVLIIAGGGPEKESVENQIAKAGLGANVYFMGCVSNREIVNYFGLADVFIMPSEEEGFPHVLLETMAMGVPFVASDVGGVKEMTPAIMRPYLARAGDTGRFIDKIRELLRQKPEDLKSIKTSLFRWVKQYDISNSAKTFTNLIQTAD